MNEIQTKIQQAKQQNLTELDLSVRYDFWDDDERIKTIPPEVFSLTQLESLNLNWHQITEIPYSFQQLTRLKSLHLFGSNLSLTQIQKILSLLPNLSYLGIRWRESFNQLLDELQTIPQLGIDLSSKQLSTLPESITKLTQLTQLDLSYNQLSTLPESITKLTQLTGLYLGDNQLSTLPESITKLTQLTQLDLSYNQLSTLPESITKLTQLTGLYLGDNQLSTLPESITKLTQLTQLYLSSNQLSTLPESIGKLTQLTKLDLSYNQLSTLPESITKLTQLTELNLSNNQLSTLPESITKLTQLTWLDLSNNQLSTLPESITKLTQLTQLDLWNNPLQTPPLEVCDQGIDAIREYFAKLKEEGYDTIYEAKFIIVGKGEAGKTSLMKKLLNPNYTIPNNEDPTHGINIETLTFPINEQTSFRVNIWDFGGQEIYHQTHQFFLTERSLYGLMLHGRCDDNLNEKISDETDHFDYWLQVVELLSQNSPLLIIKNEKGNIPVELDEGKIRGRFKFIQEILTTNLSNNTGLPVIQNAIQYHINKLSHIGIQMPKSWAAVRKKLEEDTRDYISLDEFLQICDDCGYTHNTFHKEKQEDYIINQNDKDSSFQTIIPSQDKSKSELCVTRENDKDISFQTVIPSQDKSKDELCVTRENDKDISFQTVIPSQDKSKDELCVTRENDKDISFQTVIPSQDKSKDELCVTSENDKDISFQTVIPSQDKSKSELCVTSENDKDSSFQTIIPSQDKSKSELCVTRENDKDISFQTIIPSQDKSKSELCVTSENDKNISFQTFIPSQDKSKSELCVTSENDKDISFQTIIPSQDKSKDELCVTSENDKDSSFQTIIPSPDKSKSELCVTSENDKDSSFPTLIPSQDKSKSELCVTSENDKDISFQTFIPSQDESKRELDINNENDKDSSFQTIIPSQDKSKSELCVTSENDKDSSFQTIIPSQDESKRELDINNENDKDSSFQTIIPSPDKSKSELCVTSENDKDSSFQTVIPSQDKSKDELCVTSENDKDIAYKDGRFILSQFLHDLGIILHFQNSLLEDTVILNPTWGTQAVYELLKPQNNPVKDQLGKFSYRDLKIIWSHPRYKGKYPELLELMKKFHLIYELLDQTYIAPQLLDKNTPNYNWNQDNNLRLRYVYEFMPKGIISRFIVEMNTYIDNQIVWRSGVILTLKNENTYAEVIQIYESLKREITIRLQGNNKRKLLELITAKLDEINHSYKGLKVNVMIPCNCQTCQTFQKQIDENSIQTNLNTRQNPHFFILEKLRERLTNKKFTIECQNPPYRDIDIYALIDDTIGREQFNRSNQGNVMIINANQGKQTMQDNRVYQKHTGSGDNVAGDKNTTNIYNSPNLTEAAKEIKELLTELDKEYPNDSIMVGVKAIEEIRNNPTLKARFINALKEGGAEAIEKLIDHPAVSIVLAAGKGFMS